MSSPGAGTPERREEPAPLDEPVTHERINTVAPTLEHTIMNEIKENGVVRWKGLITVLVIILGGMFTFMYSVSNAKLSRAEFIQFEKRFESTANSIELSLREFKLDLKNEIRELKSNR